MNKEGKFKHERLDGAWKKKNVIGLLTMNRKAGSMTAAPSLSLCKYRIRRQLFSFVNAGSKYGTSHMRSKTFQLQVIKYKICYAPQSWSHIAPILKQSCNFKGYPHGNI